MDGLTWQWAPKPLSKAGEPIRSAVAWSRAPGGMWNRISSKEAPGPDLLIG
jgi:hypothetical protein